MSSSVEQLETNGIPNEDLSTVIDGMGLAGDEGTLQGAQSVVERCSSLTNQKAITVCNPQRRVSLTRVLAAVHRLNKELNGTDLLATLCVCCLAAVFMGRIVLRRILFARRRKGCSRKSLKIDRRP